MRKLILSGSILLGLATPLASASAQATADAATRKDVQCFVLFAAAAGNAKDEATAKPATVGLAFFLGKIARGAPGLKLLDAVRLEMKTLPSADAQKLGTACEQEFSRRMTEVEAMGKALQVPVK